MNELNSVLLEGNLVRDVKLRTTKNGGSVGNFSVASNRFYRKDGNIEKEVSFFDVETWSKLAENCYNFGHKGRGVRVVGRLKQDRWTGDDGKTRSKVTIVAEHVEFRPEFKKENAKPGEEAAKAAGGSDGTDNSMTEEEELATQFAAAKAEEYEGTF